jgi:hypothetical protein
MFEGAKLKASWATHMIRQIEQGLQRFSADQPSEIRSQHNSETGELRVQIRGVPAPVRPDVVMLAGTTVQTLLSCLDYITSELWNSAKSADTRIHFPIDTDQAQLKSSGSYLKIHKFNPGLADFISNDIKPTKAENFPIWALKRLANTDKHRNLLFVANWNGFEVDKIERTDGVSMQKVRFTAPAGHNNENYINIPNVKEYSEPYAVVQVSIREPDICRPDIFDRFEVVQTLSHFHREVVATIEAIERYLGK